MKPAHTLSPEQRTLVQRLIDALAQVPGEMKIVKLRQPRITKYLARAVTIMCLVSVHSFGCASLSSNTTLLSDSSHLGTPYSGTTRDAHTLYCMGRDFARSPETLLFFPVALFPLIDLPLSLAIDTVLLPVDIVLEAERAPLKIGEGGCKLWGM